MRHALTPAILALLVGSLLPAAAQDAVDLAKAKAEGKVAWYTSTPIDEAQKIANLFQQETGIKVELFRSGGSQVLSRFQQEISAGRVAVDVLTHSDPAAARAMAKKGLFVPFRPRNFDKVPDAAKAADGAFIGQRLNMMTHYLRSDKIAPADEPKTWDDLTATKYKGKLAMADPSFTSLQVSVVGTMSKLRGWRPTPPRVATGAAARRRTPCGGRADRSRRRPAPGLAPPWTRSACGRAPRVAGRWRE